MDFQDSLYAFDGMVNFASLSSPWPQSKPEQKALLEGIHARDWHRSSGFSLDHMLYNHVHDHLLLAKLTLETRFGRRWFHIWQCPMQNKLVVVKEAAPDTPLVLCCELTAGLAGIRAAFSLISGRSLGTDVFNAISVDNPLLVNDLRAAACQHALRHGLLETHRQVVGLAMRGFKQDPPDGLLLWWSPAITETGLQTWLTYLHSLSPAELENWDCSGSLSTSSSDSMSSLAESLFGDSLEASPASDISEEP